VEIAAAARLLAANCWLIPGRDDAAIATVRQHLPVLREVFGRLRWNLHADNHLVRLRKSPPRRREAFADSGRSPLACSWFFLLVAAAESVSPRVALSTLVAAARAAAAEAGLPVRNDYPERHALYAAVKMAQERGLIEQMDGDLDSFVRDENVPVLLAVHHNRLAHVIANEGSVPPDVDPSGWLDQVEREPDPAVRMRRRLVDDAAVHLGDLDEDESDWLSRRVRGDDGGPLAQAFGLHLERRAEGAAFVVPDDAYRRTSELGPHAFPAGGTVPHAALLLCDHAAVAGETGGRGPGPGWRGLREDQVGEHLATLAAGQAGGRGGWKQDLVRDPRALRDQVQRLLVGLDLLRLDTDEDGCAWWWLSPATGRWDTPASMPPAPRTRRREPNHPVDAEPLEGLEL
jgi:uncharacterized protein (TIGR02678 family)